MSNILMISIVSLLLGCSGQQFSAAIPELPENGGAPSSDVSAEDSVADQEAAEEEVPVEEKTEEPAAPAAPTETVLTCGGQNDSCYANQAAMTARFASTPSGKKLALVKTAANADVWVEKDGARVLKADGFDNWQMKLNISGKGFSPDFFTSPATIAGRVCPPNVYIDDANKFATKSCMYYDDAKTPQVDLNAAGTSQTVLGIIGLGDWSGYSGGVARWYTGNIEICAVKGMRLPTVFETQIKKPLDLSVENFPLTDGEAVWAEALGVPNSGSYKWTATAARDNVGYYSTWTGNLVTNQHVTFEKAALCVLP